MPTVNLRDQDGRVVTVPLEQAGSLLANGYTQETTEQRVGSLAKDVQSDVYGGVAGKTVAFGAGALSGATLGLSDVGISALGGGDDLSALREENPYASAAGQIIGSIAPTLLPGGFLAKTPAGYLARVANEGVEASRALGGLKAAAGVAAVSGAEAATQNAGMYLSDVALGDRDLTAEGMAGALGRGFAFGSVAGGAVHGIEKGTIAARRMFSRTAEGGARGASDAAASFERKIDEVTTAADDTYRIAKARLDEIQTAERDALGARAQADVEIARAKLARNSEPKAPRGEPAASKPPPDGTPAQSGIPQTAGDIHMDGTVTTVRARDLDQREFTTLPGVGEDAVKMDKARKAITEGQRDPVVINVSPGGKLDIEDGRHRLAAALEADSPVKVKWQRGSAGLDEAPVTSSRATSQAAPLDDQLAEMQRRVLAGESIQDLNAARTAAPSTTDLLGPALAAEKKKLVNAIGPFESKRAKIDEWVARIKNPRKSVEADASAAGLRSGQAPVIRGRRVEALDEDVFVEQSGGGIRTIGEKEHSLADITPNSRVLARSNGDSFSRGSQLDEMYGDAIERAALAEARPEMEAALREAADLDGQIHQYVRSTDKPETVAVVDAIEAARANANRTAYDAAFVRAEKRATREAEAAPGKLGRVNPEEEAAYQQALRGQGERGPVDTSFLGDAERTGQRMRGEMIQAERAKKGLPPLSDAEIMAATTRPANAVDDIHEAAGVIGDYEKGLADLVDAVGDGAPPKAREHVDGLRKAESESERKVTDRTARAVDDHATYGPTRRSGSERLADARAAKLEADARLGELKVQELDARAQVKELKPARKAAPKKGAPEPVTAPQGEGRFGSVADLGAVLEAANTVGIPGLPKPSDLPVIGPLLGVYLKFRALKAVAGRMTGRVAATGDAKAAALAARTKERMALAVDHMLGLVERTAPAVRNVAVRGGGAAAAILAKRIIDDGEPDAPDGASEREVAAVRIRELSNAVANPDLILARVRQELHDVTDPDLIAAAEQQQLRTIQHLHDVAPKGPPPNPYRQRPWAPSTVEAVKFARRLFVVDDPEAALHEPTVDAVDTLRAIYPKLFGMLQSRVLERAGDLKAPIPQATRFRMSTLFDVPLDPLMNPETIATIQTAPSSTSPATPTQNSAPVPSTAAPVDLTAMYQTSTDRRAARR